jgi:hypothetical protein
MVDVDAFLVNGNQYQKAVDFLRNETMDPGRDLHYEKELRTQVKEDEKTRKMVASLQSKSIKMIYIKWTPNFALGIVIYVQYKIRL